ncbi:HD domain-containing protein 2 [Boothiomyces macroporosus]|uniref:5'-deoxynucleotidase n=1 Tax=Boothiomyces macroporosus TaxID=261099 RepID=A0AAD5Y7N8_9FUNG|nr:HD domain-containing protein 2 [Boothiomyces macroporosus]
MNTLRFLDLIESLKTTKRTGWINNEIENPESIADHMHRMGIIAMLIKDPTINKQRLINMAIVHDLAEATVGDITPHDGVSKEDKHDRERKAMEHFNTLLPTSEMKEIKELWEEYEHCSTKEALLCKDIDKFEMIVQAHEYEKRYGKNLNSFFDSTRGKFQHPEIKEMVNQLYQKRAEFFNKQ